MVSYTAVVVPAQVTCDVSIDTSVGGDVAREAEGLQVEGGEVDLIIGRQEASDLVAKRGETNTPELEFAGSVINQRVRNAGSVPTQCDGIDTRTTDDSIRAAADSDMVSTTTSVDLVAAVTQRERVGTDTKMCGHVVIVSVIVKCQTAAQARRVDRGHTRQSKVQRPEVRI